MDISVTIPIFNEGDIVEELCRRLTTALDALPGKLSYEIIFVDDGSTDQSVVKLREQQRQAPQVVILELCRNYGQTAALAAGMKHASGDVVITMDGDLQHAPEDIPQFLEALNEGYDLVNGWRRIRTDGLWLRRIPSFCANSMMAWISGIPIRDFGSTFKAYRADLVKRLYLFGEMHRFIPVLAYREGARIKEIPISVHPRKAGISKYGLGRTSGVLMDILFLKFYVSWLSHPLRAFGKLAFLFFGGGFYIATVIMILWCFGTIPAVVEHQAMLLFSVFLMIVGLQFFVVGILAEILVRIYLSSHNAEIYSVRNISRSA